MLKKTSFCFKVASLMLVLALVVPLLAACGDNDEATPTATSTAGTTIPTVTGKPTVTVTPTLSEEPVVIGGISVWSGQQAVSGTYFADPVIKVVEKQVEERGGILGGRPLE